MSGTLCKNILSNKLSKLVYTNTSGKPASATLNVQKLSTTENACISVKVATCTTQPVTNTEVSSTLRSPEQFSSLVFCGSTGNYAGQMFRNSCSGVDAFDDTINGTVANTGLSATMTLPNGGGSCSFCSPGKSYWPSTSNYPINVCAYCRCCNCCTGLCAEEYWNSNVQTFTYHYPNYALPSVQARLKSVADQNGGFTVVPIRPAASNCFGPGTDGTQQLYAWYPFACICNATTAELQSKMATGWDIGDSGICCFLCQKGLASAVDFYGDSIHVMSIRPERRDCLSIITWSDNLNCIYEPYCYGPHCGVSPSTNHCCVYLAWCMRKHCCVGSPSLGMRYQNYLHVGCEALLYPMGGCCNVGALGDYTMFVSYNGSANYCYSPAIPTTTRDICRSCYWAGQLSCNFNDGNEYCCTKRPRLYSGVVKWMVYDPYTCRNIAYVKGDQDNSGVYQMKPERLGHLCSGNCGAFAFCTYTWNDAAEEQPWITKLGSLDNSNLYTCYSCEQANYTQHMSTPFQVDDQCWVSYVPCMFSNTDLCNDFEWDGCLVKFVSSDLVTWTCGESSTTKALLFTSTDSGTRTNNIANFEGGNVVKSVDRFCDNTFLPGQSYIEYKVSGNQFERSGLVIGDGESVYVTDDSDTTSDTAVQLWGYDE